MQSSSRQKLKDSCDICSASKVRCDKQKPVCARCASLNYQCLYSPARRAGRPHRVRRRASQTQDLMMPLLGSTILDESVRDTEMGNDTGIEDVLPVYTPSTIQHRQQCSAPPFLGIGPSSEPGCCAAAAIGLLEKLERATRRPIVVHTTEVVTEACHQLSSMLICPCSEQLSVALLAACACISLMDMVRRSAITNCSQGTMASNIAASDMEESIFSWSMPSSQNSSFSSSSSSIASDSHGGVIELAKIAKVVLQFSERYRQGDESGTEWSHITWTLTPLAAFLKSRLKSITSDITR
ncbi:hypothetical protein F5Y06DRAFT_306974 [Hypoxylon sp. FL0890]|nr:hypothetical protein F5Y06DRAFT_306974 [Hypoxylon sp. FL0890]